MYLFQNVLPFLPEDYRRRICFSIGQTWQIFQNDPKGVDQFDWVQIEQLHSSLHNYEMFILETRGLTNTKCNPFESAHLPPALIGG